MAKTKDVTQKISFRISKNKLELLMKEYKTESITELFKNLIDDKLEHRFEADASRSVITSLGGKHRLARRIIEMMPEHKIYIEPFGNTASILLQKPPAKKEIYNDIDKGVSNFFKILRDNPSGLYNKCISLPYSEIQYNEFLTAAPPEDPLESAVRFFYLSRGSFLGARGRYFLVNSSGRSYSKQYYRECERFFAVSKRFQGVEIISKDFRKVINRYGNNSDVLFLCDPPFYDGTEYYDNTFTYKDHKELAHRLSEIKGKAMICHSQNEKIHNLYEGLGFSFEVIRTKYCAKTPQPDENGKLKKPLVPMYIYMKN